MKRINKNSIKIGFKILSILAFGLIFVPFNSVTAATYENHAPTYVYGHYNSDDSYTFGGFVWGDSTNGDSADENGDDSSLEDENVNGSTEDENNNGTIWGSWGSRVKKNPVPKIKSISPEFGKINEATKTIIITGRGFTTSSVARINTSVRPVTFIDPSHLLLQINSNDLYTYRNNGGFFITVFNKAPGGGYSNGEFFTIKNADGSPILNADGTVNEGGKNYGGLSANAIFGFGDGVLPSGIMQWILFAVCLLIIMILGRKVFGVAKKYHEAPLKHA